MVSPTHDNDNDNDNDHDGLAPDPEATASLLTRGPQIRSLVDILSPVADEHRVHVTADGLDITTVDAPNVMQMSVTALAPGFESYSLADGADSFVLGLDLDRFADAVSFARKRGDGDPVRIDIFDARGHERIRVTVVRDDQGVRRETEWFGISPDAIRPDPDVPDLSLPGSATVDVSAFADATADLFDADDRAVVTGTDSDLTVGTMAAGEAAMASLDTDEFVQMFHFEDAVLTDETPDASSAFSADYLRDIGQAIKRSKADRLVVRWGESFPAVFEFEHNDWGYDGHFMVAPRITDTDD